MPKNRFYEIEGNVEEGIFTVRKRSDPNKVYHITKRDDGSWVHTCKAISVRGNDFLCRHKKMILQKYYVNDEYKHRFNISPSRTVSRNSESPSS